MTRRSWTDAQFINAVRNNTTISGTLRDLNLGVFAGNFRTFHATAKRLGVDTSHFLGKAHLKGGRFPQITMPLEEILVEDSSYATNKLKKRLLRKGLLDEICAACQQGPNWNGAPLVLQLEHINGNCRDHRLENLCLLCPNCHSQTGTYRGRAKRKPQNKCVDCGVAVTRLAKRCASCASIKAIPSKINWPDIPLLKERIEAANVESVARELGVSGNALRKHMRVWKDKDPRMKGG